MVLIDWRRRDYVVCNCLVLNIHLDVGRDALLLLVIKSAALNYDISSRLTILSVDDIPDDVLSVQRLRCHDGVLRLRLVIVR